MIEFTQAILVAKVFQTLLLLSILFIYVPWRYRQNDSRAHGMAIITAFLVLAILTGCSSARYCVAKAPSKCIAYKWGKDKEIVPYKTDCEVCTRHSDENFYTFRPIN